MENSAKPDPHPPGASSPGSSRPSKWAALLARRAPREAWSEAFPLVCPTCGGSLTFIALPSASSASLRFLTDPEPITQILAHVGEPTSPPLLHPPRGPPQPTFDLDGDSDHGTPWTTGQGSLNLDQSPEFDPADPEPVPDLEFNQSREGEYE